MKTLLKKSKPLSLSNSLIVGAIGFGVVIGFPYLYENATIRLDFSMESSLPYSAWLTTTPYDKQNDHYMMFTPPIKNQYTEKAKHLIKYVSCKEGDVLHVEGMNYFCNGAQIAIALPSDHRGHKIDHFDFDGVIPKGKYFVTGTHPRSYDSRYFGFVDQSNIERGAKPLW